MINRLIEIFSCFVSGKNSVLCTHETWRVYNWSNSIDRFFLKFSYFSNAKHPHRGRKESQRKGKSKKRRSVSRCKLMVDEDFCARRLISQSRSYFLADWLATDWYNYRLLLKASRYANRERVTKLLLLVHLRRFNDLSTVLRIQSHVSHVNLRLVTLVNVGMALLKSIYILWLREQ